MEFNELEYERLKQERGIRGEIRKLDEGFAEYRTKYKTEKNSRLKLLKELEKELDSGVIQPRLFDPQSPEYIREKESVALRLANLARKNAGLPLDGKTPKTRSGGKKKPKNTPIEKNLTKIVANPCPTPGCCTCNKMCEERLADNGDASSCKVSMACFTGCPRLADQSSVNSDQLSVKDGKEEKKPGNKDTMAVEKTLLTVFPVCDAVKDGACIGCCQCEDVACSDRIINFGNAVACKSTVACSGNCPRIIQNKDIKDAKDKKDSRFKTSREAIKNFIAPKILLKYKASALDGLSTEDDTRAILIERNKITVSYPSGGCDFYSLIEIYNEIVDEENRKRQEEKEQKEKSTLPAENTEKATDKNPPGPTSVCATRDKDLANCAKVPKGFTIYGLDLENKKIFRYHLGEKKFIEHTSFKSKAETLRTFKRMSENETGFLDIDRVCSWPSKPDLAEFILFRGDYHGTPYDIKQIRYIKPGMHGWGKPQKFTNIEQYNARLEELRKDPNYIEA